MHVGSKLQFDSSVWIFIEVRFMLVEVSAGSGASPSDQYFPFNHHQNTYRRITCILINWKILLINKQFDALVPPHCGIWFKLWDGTDKGHIMDLK